MKTWLSYVRNSLFYSLSIFWIWIIGLQWISFMDFTWFEETKSIVLLSITFAAIVEMLLPVKRVYRLALEVASVLYIIHRELVSYWVYMPSGIMANRIQQYIENLSPYIWIALAALILMMLSAVLVSNKRRILVFSGMSVIAFCILDSFTEIDLWPEVAWTVFATLGWLVSEHLRRFQLRFPAGWRVLRKYPFKISIHAAVLFAIIFVAGVNMPAVSPTLTDPYTAWVGSSGGSSNARDVSGELAVVTKGSVSGYSRNDNNLGGTFDFDYSPVMTVKSDKRSYWRGETRHVYSGSGWSDPGAGSGYTGVDPGLTLVSGDVALAGETDTLEQTVTMLNDNVYPVLFGAFHITEIKQIDKADAGKIRWEGSQSTLHWNSDPKQSQYPKSYTIVSELPIILEDEIRGKTFKDLYGNEKLDEDYLQIPKEFPKRTRDLAEQITSTAQTPYEKIGLLQNYLINNFKYTNQPDLSKKNSKDFVDGFLFEVKEGYCDYFSTSMVMMARSLDIPARWVKGYAPGQQQVDSDMMRRMGGDIPDSGIYTVTNADAHSWAEVYFGPYGWVPVEATPGFNMPLLTHKEESKPVTAPQEEEQKPDVQKEEAAVGTSGKGSGLSRAAVAWITVLIIALLAAYSLWLFRIPLRFLLVGVRKGQKLTADQKVIVMTERWINALKRKRIFRNPHETLRESVNRWNREMPALSPSLQQLLMLFEKARYSPDSVSEAEWRSVNAYSRELRSALKEMENTAA